MSIYPRERISDALQDSANRGIAMVIAPAGFGKTEAVVDAFGKSAHWIEVSENGVTVEGLARAIIDAAAPHALRALSPLLARPANEENRSHLTGWVASRLRTVEQPIILEDFQRACRDADVLFFMRTVVESTVPAVRWVFVSRETPELPLGTWIARDYMTLPLTSDDLTFDRFESAGVATAMEIGIDDASLEALVADVSGWPLAVRLALSSWDRSRSVPPIRIRTRSMLFDFLETEVWSRLAPIEREFFEAAAHLSELRPRILTAAGFPESRLSLEQLHRRLPLLSKLSNGSFRLHELFREFILGRPEAEAGSKAALIKRLSRAIERFGGFDEALAMSMLAEDWDGAVALLSRRGIDRIENGHRAEVMASLRRFPKHFQDHSVVTGLRGYVLAIDGNFELAKKEMDSALKRDLDTSLRGALELQSASMAFNLRDYTLATELFGRTMSDGRYENEIRIRAAAGLAMSSGVAGNAEAARDAMGFCAAGLDSGSVEVRAFVRHRLSYAHLCLGEYSLAEHYATECAQLAHSVGLEALAARAYSILVSIGGMIYADTALARTYAESCLRSAEASGDPAMQFFATECLVNLACAQDDDALFEDANARLIKFRPLTPQNPVWLRFSYALREAGRDRREQAAAELRRLEKSRLMPSAVALIDAMLAVIYARDDVDRAEALLERPILAAADNNLEMRRFLMFAQALHALGHWLIGRGRAARRSRMPNASDLAPGDAAIISVIGTICSTSRQTITGRQLEQLTEPLVALGYGGYARFLRSILAPASVHELTRTEIDVLRALRSGGTTAEVAERLGKSGHTVLSHIKSACAKLGCSGRAAAVKYAVDQGWIE